MSSFDGLLLKLLDECDGIEFPSVRADSLTPYTDATGVTAAVSGSGGSSARTKRPMNAFMVWSHAIRRAIVRRRPGVHNAEISRQLGQLWNELSPEQRRPFIDEAERLRRFHSMEFPEYKYRPRRKSESSTVPRPRRTVNTTGRRAARNKHQRRVNRIRTTSTSDHSDGSASTLEAVPHDFCTDVQLDAGVVPACDLCHTSDDTDAQLHTRLWLSRLPVYQPMASVAASDNGHCDNFEKINIDSQQFDEYLTPEVNELLADCDWLLDSDCSLLNADIESF